MGGAARIAGVKLAETQLPIRPGNHSAKVSLYWLMSFVIIVARHLTISLQHIQEI